jgi:mannose-6-phosphate isomerase-like protein (cupin superfamily)
MKRAHLRFGRGFRVEIGNDRSQVAQMVLPRGACEGGPDNRHRGADQWLYVVSGTGLAVINGRQHRLSAGSIVLIERGDSHEIRNTGREGLKTVNIYVPPAYDGEGEELPAGRP